MSPIRASERHRYPLNWRELAARIRARAGNRCESVPGQPPCGAGQGERHPLTGAIVVLTVAHLDHQPEHCDDDNLRALYQRCHNRYDQPHRQRNARATRRANKRTGDLLWQVGTAPEADSDRRAGLICATSLPPDGETNTRRF